MRSRGSNAPVVGLVDEAGYGHADDDVKHYASKRRLKRLPLVPAFLVVVVGGGIACAMAPAQSVSRYVLFVVSCCACGSLFSVWLWRWIASKDGGDASMRAISQPIAEGAGAFLRVQYGAIAKMAVVLMLLIGASYQLRPPPPPGGEGIEAVSTRVLGLVASAGFFVGAVCSATSGYVSMRVASSTNVRVASAARRSYADALIVCFRGGLFSAVLNLTLCVVGLVGLFVAVDATAVVPSHDVPLLLVGYGFGASFVALFMQLGGGIYTKAADVGADLVGKVEASIPEDDPRNPAVVADLVGDLVGDCVGSSADVFESVGAEIIGAMILGGQVARDAELPNPLPLVFFPLVVHALDVIASSVGALTITKGAVVRAEKSGTTQPMAILLRGYCVTLVVALAGFTIACRAMLGGQRRDDETDRTATTWLHFEACGLLGFLTAFACAQSSRYYTDYAYPPVRKIAEAATTGHGTNIIVGLAVGFESTAVPTISVACSVIASYHLGRTSGLAGPDSHSAGLFGTAVATMGMLATAVYVLSMNNFGPIADNAGGIAEMSGQSDRVRQATDALDAAGNVTKAITKGYSIGSASLACFLLFAAFMDEFAQFAGRPLESVDVSTPEVLVGGLLGVCMVYVFAGMAIAAVGRTASEVVTEVRRQFRDTPGILAGDERPDYAQCVAMCTRAALDEMRIPGLLCVAAPVAVGLVFRVVGDLTGRPLLGAETLAAYLVFATVTGILTALMFDNVGGAWDNAKKYVELGHFGGKNSEAHKAAVTGDTVGDPLKDTAGPSLHVVIKLLSTTTLVLGPLFVSRV
ncbi:hypothetical protein CTAYLR_001929 [Chrysophaeum taylorii]|uniref:H(+)-exporting diphosphatase n=1 Tax=Chrysophaeum taylorii TaxID=2483200 RepID=A0AAD7XL84_9STRA|nr:hypothetical protein CTAYLR_001929 [Chrysophaeum taylorii]